MHKHRGLTGIGDLLKEILASQWSIQEIDYEDRKTLFFHGDLVVCALIVTEYLEELRHRLDRFILQFREDYHEQLHHWDRELSAFFPARDLVLEVFSQGIARRSH